LSFGTAAGGPAGASKEFLSLLALERLVNHPIALCASFIAIQFLEKKKRS
jgi:hypothetical protein